MMKIGELKTFAALFVVYHCKRPHPLPHLATPLATVACSLLDSEAVYSVIVHPTVSK